MTCGRVVGLASHVVAAQAGKVVARLVVTTGLIVKAVTVAIVTRGVVDPGVLRPAETLQVSALLAEEENPHQGPGHLQFGGHLNTNVRCFSPS